MKKVLLVDDDEDDYVLIADLIKSGYGQEYSLDWIQSFEEASAAMLKGSYDVCLIDYMLGKGNGLELIRAAVASGLSAPCVLVTNLRDKSVDELAMQAGAADYLVKNSITGEILDRVIRYSISHQKMLNELKNLNSELESRVHERTQALAVAVKEIEASRNEIVRSLEKEKELNELKSRFITLASHEFRTPLATILSSASILGSYPVTGNQQRRDRHIEKIKDSVKDITGILDNFLSIGKLEEGDGTGRNEEIDIKRLLEDLVRSEERELAEGRRIILDHQPDVTTVMTDEYLLRKSIGNILSNAAKFSYPGTDIIVKVMMKGPYLEICVSDKGIGIPEEDKEYVFERFFRGRNTVNRDGISLGLHIAKKCVDLIGGEIAFTSTENEGSDFTVRIPLRRIGKEEAKKDRAVVQPVKE